MRETARLREAEGETTLGMREKDNLRDRETDREREREKDRDRKRLRRDKD